MDYYYLFILLLLSLTLYWYYLCNKNGILPATVKKSLRICDFAVKIFEKRGLTFTFHGFWFTDTGMLLTADPSNVRHVMSKNFHNYGKGSKFNSEICDFLGETIINSDSVTWQYYRNLALSILMNSEFQQFFHVKVWEKVEDSLIPVLDHVSEQGLIIDLQDLFSRFAFDVSCCFIMDYDPRSLSVDWPSLPPLGALDEAMDAVLRRFITPACIWKLQRLLGVGKEKKLLEARQILDSFIDSGLGRAKGETNEELGDVKNFNNRNASMLTLFERETNRSNMNDEKDVKFYRDCGISLLLAGRDTISASLSWFFYLLTRNPQVLSKIKDEIDALDIDNKDSYDENGQFSPSRYLKILDNKLVYLHATLCEALRLYPPIAYETKVADKNDVLPSGHQVTSRLPIVFCIYAMARMKSIWGDDCREFKPERWINENGKLRHEPSYKFLSFMTGPRTCLGKQMAFIQLKAVATTIIKNYHIQAIQGHPIVPSDSVMLRMKYGFKAKVIRSSM